LSAAAEDGELVCTVHDAGTFQPLHGGVPDAFAEQGRGFPLMRFLMDEVVVETRSEGTIVGLSKRLPRPSEPVPSETG